MALVLQTKHEVFRGVSRLEYKKDQRIIQIKRVK